MSHYLTRRKMLSTLLGAAAGSLLPVAPGKLFAQTGYTGKLLVSLQMNGGVDVTSFCDPKTNVPGALKINNWADTGEPGQAGNLPYAPFGGGREFFEKHFDKTLVINGVDAQTNSHTTGITFNMSGRNSAGYPTLPALMAAVNAPELPLAYLNFGGFSSTAGIVSMTRIGNTSQLRGLIFPNELDESLPYVYVPTRTLDSDLAQIQAMHWNSMKERLNEQGLPAGDRINRLRYLEALERADGLKAFGELIPDDDEIQPQRDFYGASSTLHQQIQVALLAFKAGVTVAADVAQLGFDTHDEHDAKHEPLLSVTLDAIDYLWNFAEELGLADRIVLMVGSDFGRTPHYNAGGGKDHWPIGSYLVMEKNVSYTNRVIGETDEGHNAYKISPSTLQRDDAGVIIRPPHFHKAMRLYLGLEGSAYERRFQFDGIEDFDFFG